MTRAELFEWITRGDAAAAEFLEVVTQIAHAWDDIVDRDKPFDAEAVHRAFFSALVVLPRNTFYTTHFGLLNPVLISAINNWRVANELEAGEDEDSLRIAFISRSSYCDLVTQTAFILGGTLWVREVGPAIRRFVHQEGWESYQTDLAAEKAARSMAPGA